MAGDNERGHSWLWYEAWEPDLVQEVAELQNQSTTKHPCPPSWQSYIVWYIVWPFYHDWNCPCVAEFPLMVKHSHNMCTVYIDCRTIMLKDKINCGGGFVNYFSWVPLICLGSMTQGTRVGTFVDLAKTAYKTYSKVHFVSYYFLLICPRNQPAKGGEQKRRR